MGWGLTVSVGHKSGEDSLQGEGSRRRTASRRGRVRDKGVQSVHLQKRREIPWVDHLRVPYLHTCLFLYSFLLALKSVFYELRLFVYLVVAVAPKPLQAQ